jgi:hypothetical protein
MSIGDGLGRLTTPTGPQTPQTPPPPAGYILPDHVSATFLNVRRLGKGPAEQLADGEKECRLVACWMAALGWTSSDVVAAIEEREAGRAHVTKSPWTLALWEGRFDEAASWLTLGHYLVFGTAPGSSGGTARRTAEAINFGTQPSGLPNLSAENLRSYLSKVAVAQASVGGRHARTDRLVFRSMVSIAERARTIAPAPGVRRLAREICMSTDAVIASLRRLAAAGFISPLPSLKGQSTAYVLRAPAEGDRTRPTSHYLSPSRPDSSWSDRDTLSAGHPAFHRSALGKTGYDLLACLIVERPCTDEEWWTVAGVHRRTFYRLKPKLCGSDSWRPLVAHAEGGWHLVDPAALRVALDQVAESFGTDQLVRRRDERFQSERSGFGGWQIRRLPGAYKALDSVRAVDTDTGEVLLVSELVDRYGNPLSPASEEIEPPTFGEGFDGVSAPSPVLQLVQTERTDPTVTELETRSAAHCAACGTPTHERDESADLPWHAGCAMPGWLVRYHERQGLHVAVERRSDPPPIVDRFGDDRLDVAPARTLVAA